MIKLIEIKSIKEENFKGQVFDLTVEEDHSFTVSGIIVHNSICSTRLNTGFGKPVLETLLDIKESKAEGVYVVSDGGVEYNGDVLKALVAGADMVMMGKFFAGTSLAGSRKFDKYFNEVVGTFDGVEWCLYRGSASKEARKLVNSSSGVEGVSGFVPYTGGTVEVLEELLKNMRSGVGYYAGCTNWHDFQRKTKMVEITSNGVKESLTRVEKGGLL